MNDDQKICMIIKGERIFSEIVTTDQILRRSDESKKKLRSDLEYLIRDAFPRIPEEKQSIYVCDYFRKPSYGFLRQAFIFRNEANRLIAATICDCRKIEYKGGLINGIYLISITILTEYRNLGLGQIIGSKVIKKLKPDVFFITCAQSSSLHSWIRLPQKGLISDFDVYPRLELRNGTEVLITTLCEDRDFTIDAFRQTYFEIVEGEQKELDKAVRNLTELMVRKNLHDPMYDFNPWEKDGREDKLAKYLGVTDRDAVLVMFIKKHESLIQLIEYRENNHNMMAEHYLDIACEKLPVVARIISQYGNVSLFDYLNNFIPKARPSYQKPDDLFQAVYQYAAPLLGKSVARRAVIDLSVSPVVLTSNHLGVEYFAQSVQSSLLFFLHRIAYNASATTVPVFSFGNVPLNNLTYPRGLLLYHINPAELDHMPIKAPIFPDRFKRQMTGIVTAFDHSMIRRTATRLNKMVHERQLSHTLEYPIHKILHEDYSADVVMSLSNYSQQTVVLNSRIWKHLFSEPDKAPDMVCLEIEKITAILLKDDLSNPKSLAWFVMFDPSLRESMLEELDGVKGCWERKELSRRLNTEFRERTKLTSCGTVFFWGINSLGRRIPLSFERDGLNNEVLRGIDDHGNILELPCTPRALIRGLQKNQIIPSLFTCFLTISFARGLICVGGYFQSEYLPMMQQGVLKALQRKPCYHNISRLIARMSTNCYLSGMLAVMTQTDNDCLIPAGTAEIMAGRGITTYDIEQMLSFTVRMAHLAGLFETAPDVLPGSRPPDWKKQLAKDCFQLLKGKVVVK